MNRILTIITVTLLTIFCASAITLAFVKTDYNKLPASDALAIEIFYNQKESGLIEKNDSNASKKALYDEFMKNYYKGTEESILTSLFQGLYSQDAKQEPEKLSNWTWSKSKSANTIFIIFRFDYNNAPYIYLNNGEKYKENDVEIQYDTAWLEITEENNMHQVTVYLRKKADSTSTTSTHRIYFLLETSAVYDFVLELENQGKLF